MVYWCGSIFFSEALLCPRTSLKRRHIVNWMRSNTLSWMKRRPWQQRYHEHSPIIIPFCHAHTISLMIVILYPFLIRILNITEERPNTYTHTTMPFLYPRMLLFMSGERYIYKRWRNRRCYCCSCAILLSSSTRWWIVSTAAVHTSSSFCCPATVARKGMLFVVLMAILPVLRRNRTLSLRASWISCHAWSIISFHLNIIYT